MLKISKAFVTDNCSPKNPPVARCQSGDTVVFETRDCYDDRLQGDGTVIEARDHKDGVLRSELGDYPWTHWAILRGMSCPPGSTLLQALPVLRKGAKGEDVIRLQEALIRAGYSVGDKGADGIFGTSTRTAVMELQRDARIGVDGVAGELTWAALDKLASGTRYTVTIRGLNKAVADRIVRDYGGEVTADE